MNDSVIQQHVLQRASVISAAFRHAFAQCSEVTGVARTSLLQQRLPQLLDALVNGSPISSAAPLDADTAETIGSRAAHSVVEKRLVIEKQFKDAIDEYGILHDVIVEDIFTERKYVSPTDLQAVRRLIHHGVVGAVSGFVQQGRELQRVLEGRLIAYEDELEAKQVQLNFVTTHAAQLLFTATPEGRADWYNQRWFDYTGSTNLEHGAEWLTALHPEDERHAQEQWQAAFTKALPFDGAYRLRRHDGEYRWHLLHAAPVLGRDGRLERWFGTCLDIHDSKQQEEALRAAKEQAQRLSRLKDEFLSAVSHELRTPLQAIVGWTGLLRSGKLDPRRFGHALQAIERNAKNQSKLVTQILELSRNMTGRAPFQAESVELGTVLRSMLESVKPVAQEKGVCLDVGFEEPLGSILVDKHHLEQIVSNLLSNAIKFTPGGGQVTLSARNDCAATVIEVRDTGEGIPESFLPCVFDPFKRHQGPDGARDGFGLGLAIVRQLVELHGGSVAADSGGKGHGSLLRVVLPHRRPPSVGEPTRDTAEAIYQDVNDSHS